MTKRKQGRPSKKDTIDLKKLEEVARCGLTDIEIATAFNISERTLNNYKKDPKFLQSLKIGKLLADKKVIESLYKRACGFEYDETTKEPIIMRPKSGPAILVKKKLAITKIVHKQVVPDSTAMIFWLKNRQPDRWRDKKETEITGEMLYEHFLAERRKYKCPDYPGELTKDIKK